MGDQRQCTNCGCAKWLLLVDTDLKACCDCGAIAGLSFIPRRTTPAVPVEMPDAEGEWRFKLQNQHRPNVWVTRYVYCFNGVWCCLCVGSSEAVRCEPGEWLRTQPPLVAEQPKDADAELLRRCADGDYCLTNEEAYRIADRLEKGEGV